jgi:putative transposase
MLNGKTSKKPDNAETIYFHVYNRGVDKRDIFMDKSDYYRFLHDLYEFNDTAPANPHHARYGGGSTSTNKKRDMLVDIVCYCLMPNHYHLLVGTRDKKILARFMQKIGTGYTMYFNEKYERSGSLFQGRYKSIIIEGDVYIKQLSKYIHRNPLNSERLQVKSLEAYKYSSYLDSVGIKNMPSLLKNEILMGQFRGHCDYKKFVNEEDINWLEQNEFPD